MNTYKVTFRYENANGGRVIDTITVESPIDPATLVLEGDYSYGEYEYVQECLTALEDGARSIASDHIKLYEFAYVTCLDGTVIKPS